MAECFLSAPSSCGLLQQQSGLLSTAGREGGALGWAVAPLHQLGQCLQATISARVLLAPQPTPRSAAGAPCEGLALVSGEDALSSHDRVSPLGRCLSVSFRSFLQIIRQRFPVPSFSVALTFRNHSPVALGLALTLKRGMEGSTQPPWFLQPGACSSAELREG